MWFRNDLRITDNPALDAAVKNGDSTVSLFFWCEQQWDQHDLSPARLKLTQHALQGLSDSLAGVGIQFEVVQVASFAEIPDFLNQYLTENAISDLYVNAEYALDERRRDREVKAVCKNLNVKWHPHHGSLMQIPGTLKNWPGSTLQSFHAV